MLKSYGIIGIILIILVELNFFFKIEPFASWYFPIIWLGYILVIDALVYKIRKKSLLKNKPLMFLGLFVLSAIFWDAFELFNISIQNWTYISSAAYQTTSGFLKNIFRFLSFATVLPALFETSELIISIHLFDKIKLKQKLKITKTFLYSSVILGIICFFLPIFLPSFAFPLIWLSFFLILYAI
ncbi:MAG: hypothetical protein PVJ67_02815 [Candidatus Pacearchaeota archaeon]